MTQNGQIYINEVQVDDGADALMIAEGLAYNLYDLDQSTASALIKAFQSMYSDQPTPIKIAYFKQSLNPKINPYTPNYIAMKKFIDFTSNGSVQLSYFGIDDLPTLQTLNEFSGVMTSGDISPQQLISKFNIPPEKIISAGAYSPLDNKALFSYLYDPQLEEFWNNQLGVNQFQRLKQSFIPSNFITSDAQLISELEEPNTVVKTYWSEEGIQQTERNQGVFFSWSEDKSEAIKKYQSGAKFITQALITPAKIPTLLRSNGGRSLEKVEWYNRICIKYVVNNPNDPNSKTTMTAIEATLGPDFVPAGRSCCFTPVTFN